MGRPASCQGFRQRWPCRCHARDRSLRMTLERDRRLPRLRAKKGTRNAAQPRGTGRVRARGPNHDRADDVENSDIACPSQTRKAATHADGRLECGGAPSGSRTLDIGLKVPCSTN